MKDEVQEVVDEAKHLNHTVEVICDIKSGKEATVYQVLLDGQLAAMKIYKRPEERSFNNTNQYLMGKNYKQLSHKKAAAKGNRFFKKLKHDNWIKREYFLLEKLYDLGASIPEPMLHIGDAIFMEYLGDEGQSAPRLCDIDLTANQAKRAFDKIIGTLLVFWDFGIIHADLSAYNILWWKGEPYVIDFPQAIDRRTHPEAEEILVRDLTNVTKYFSRYFDIDSDAIKQQFT